MLVSRLPSYTPLTTTIHDSSSRYHIRNVVMYFHSTFSLIKPPTYVLLSPPSYTQLLVTLITPFTLKQIVTVFYCSSSHQISKPSSLRIFTQLLHNSLCIVQFGVIHPGVKCHHFNFQNLFQLQRNHLWVAKFNLALKTRYCIASRLFFPLSLR